MKKFSSGLVNFILPSSEKIIDSKDVQQISYGGQRNSVYLVITEFNIHIFSHKSDSIESLACHPHQDLVRIDCIDQITFRLTYKSENPYTFISEDINQIISVIYNVVTTILLPDSYPQVHAPGLTLKTNHDLYFCLEQRYRAFLAWQQIYPTSFLSQSLDRFLKMKPTVIDLEIIEDLGLNVPIFLESSEIQPRISTIVVSTRQQSNYYEFLQSLLQRNNTFKKLVFHDPLNESFLHFLSTIRKFRQLNIESLEFIECVITTSIYHQIEKFLGQHQASLTFTKCDVTQCERELSILSEKCENLTGLHLTSIWLSSDFISLDLFANLTNLSLRGCRIPIDAFITLLSASASHIQTLDLSKNTCMRPFSAKVVLPSSLTYLYLNEVVWNEANFSTIFHQVCLSKSLITLSVAEANFIDKNSDYENFFKKLENGGPGLQCLYWNCNKISQRFCQTLLKCTNLKFLSIACCKLKKNIAYYLQRLIESHRSLVILDVHSIPETKISISKIISWVKKSSTIRRVDLSGNALDDHSILKLADCIANNTMLRQVLFDQINVSNYADFEPLVHALKERTMIIFIQFPSEFISKLKSQKLISDDVIKEIKPLFKAPLSPEKQECHEQWQKLIDHDYQEYQQIEEPKEPVPLISTSSIMSSLDSSECCFSMTDMEKNIKMDLFSVPSPKNDSLLQEFESKHDINEMLEIIENSIPPV